MNDEAKRHLEHLLAQAAPILKEAEDRQFVPPERGRQALHKVLDQVFPVMKQLTKQQMREVILEIFKTCPMDGTDLAALIRKSNVRLKDATGEGELYGLLRELENAKVIQGEWKDGENRRKKVYRLTDLGRAGIHPVPSEAAELAQWLLARASA